MNWECPDGWREEWNCCHVSNVSRTQNLLKTYSPWVLSVMTLQLGKENKAVTITFVGLPWDHGVEFAQTLCDSHFSKSLDNKSSLRLTFPWQTPRLVVTAISKQICMSEKRWLSVTCIFMYICSQGFLLGTTLKWTKEQNPKILSHPLQLVCWDKFVHFPC